MENTIEPFEIHKNNFTKWAYATLFILSLLAFAIEMNGPVKERWTFVAGIILFGGGFLLSVKHKIVVDQNGFVVKDLVRARPLSWNTISALRLDLIFRGHSAQLVLKISYGAKKQLQLSVKQYKQAEMQKLFEMLNQRCANATKNNHFINQASGEMNWKQKLRML